VDIVYGPETAGYDTDTEAEYVATFRQVADRIWTMVEANFIYFDR